MRILRFLFIGALLCVAGCQDASNVQSAPLSGSRPVSGPSIVALHGGGKAWKEFVVPKPIVPTKFGSTYPVSIAVGPDDNIWFDQINGNRIGRITMGGMITEYPIPSPISIPYGLAAGPGGMLWFLENHVNKVANITTSGTITEYPIPTPFSGPDDIVEGSDQNMWFTEEIGNRLARITPSGKIREFKPPHGCCGGPFHITAGPDGALWFSIARSIGRATTSGVMTEYPIPGQRSGAAGLTTGSDGNIYFAEPDANAIGRITTTGVITIYPIPEQDTHAIDVIQGPDHVLWFNEQVFQYGQFGQFDETTQTFLPPLVPPSRDALDAVLGPDRNMWFTEPNADRIGVRVFR